MEKKKEASINMVLNITSKSKDPKKIAFKGREPLEDKGPHEWVNEEILEINGEDGTPIFLIKKKTYGIK